MLRDMNKLHQLLTNTFVFFQQSVISTSLKIKNCCFLKIASSFNIRKSFHVYPDDVIRASYSSSNTVVRWLNRRQIHGREKFYSVTSGRERPGA